VSFRGAAYTPKGADVQYDRLLYYYIDAQGVLPSFHQRPVWNMKKQSKHEQVMSVQMIALADRPTSRIPAPPVWSRKRFAMKLVLNLSTVSYNGHAHYRIIV
jgi:hypothetical protein